MDILNVDECLEIVRQTLSKPNKDDIVVKNFELKRGAVDLVGFMGEYYKLTVTFLDKSAADVCTELRYFVKTLPYSNEALREECEVKGHFRKEARIYTDILPNIQRYAAQKLFAVCYYKRNDLLVLEDLSFTYRHIINEDYGLSHCKTVLRTLAQLHAGSIAWEEHEHVNISEQFKDAVVELELTASNDWYMAGVRGIIHLAKMSPMYETCKAFVDNQLHDVLVNVEELTKPSTHLRNVLIHRDAWDRNIFYKLDAHADPLECAIVDFQCCSYQPPAVDVLFMLYITTPALVRKQLESEYLDYYFEHLQKCLELAKIERGAITKADFEADCKHGRLVALIIWAICEPLTKMPEGLAAQMRQEDLQKYNYYMNVDRSEFFSRIVAVDADYGVKIMTPVEELLDYLLANAVQEA